MNAPESYREVLLGDEVLHIGVLFDPALNVGAHGANLHAVTARMFERRGGHLAGDASPAKLRIGHDMRRHEHRTIVLAVVFEVPRFHATFRGNEALLIREMSHGSHALSVAGARESQQVFGYFGPEISRCGQGSLGSSGSDACWATVGPILFHRGAPFSFSLLAPSSIAAVLPPFLPPLTVTMVHLTLLFFGVGLSTLVSPVLVCGVSWGGVLRDDQCSTIRFYPQEFRVFHMQEFCGCWFSTFSGLVAGFFSGRASLNVSPFF